MAQSIRVDSSLKKEPPSHKRNLSVGFNSNQNPIVAFQTINGSNPNPAALNESSLLFEDSIHSNTRNRPKMRLTELMNSQILPTSTINERDGDATGKTAAFFGGLQSSNSLLDGG